ncbi:MAG: serine/threonine protein kinase [Acidobacteria bacterium]|nr:serine/threonine protein kinase [Acidobacteriota bacterium]
MDAATWATVKREFARVQEAAAEERASLLRALNAEVRREVASLLAALDAAPPLLEDQRRAFEPGAMVGPYRLLTELGRGGMGTVYRVERADREVSRHLALKVAADRVFAPEAQRRFIKEREILGGLDHPNIVRLVDGGVSAGRRYLVMELAEGTPITAYCRDHRLSTVERVRLFREVCAAILYAHQRLVLHRDIKPGNVVVRPDGQVRVLDFGIAQIVQAATLTADTATVMHPMSLACASPEQLRGEPLALTSDIYALGTLLFEVLTGTNPQYRPEASLEEAMRLVLDTAPPAPSRLAPNVPRDLDAVTLKALAKAPADRYQSVGELDADLGRWLEGRPVTAVPPSTWYVLTRFARRNKALTATAAALMVAVAVGAGVVTRQARVAERRFEDARQLVHAVVFDIQPKLERIPATLPLRKMLIDDTLSYLEAVSRDVGDNVPLLRELANSYAQLAAIQGDALAANLGDRAAAARRFEEAERLMARALALAPDDAGLLVDASTLHRRRSDFALQNDDRDAAVQLAASAVARAEQSLAIAPNTPVALDARALAWFAEGRSVMGVDQDAALQHFDRVRAHFTRAVAADGLPPREVGLMELYTSDVFIKRGDADRGPGHARESLRIAQAILAAQPDDQIARLDVATSAGQLASALYNTGSQAAAIDYFRTSTEMREQVLAADPDNVRARERLALSKGRFGTILARRGDYAGARTALERAVSLYEQMQANGTLAPTMEPDFAEVLGHQGDYYQRTDNPRAACAAFQRAADILEAANERVPLTAIRKQMLEFNRSELARCR